MEMSALYLCGRPTFVLDIMMMCLSVILLGVLLTISRRYSIVFIQ